MYRPESGLYFPINVTFSLNVTYYNHFDRKQNLVRTKCSAISFVKIPVTWFLNIQISSPTHWNIKALSHWYVTFQVSRKRFVLFGIGISASFVAFIIEALSSYN